MATLRIEGGRRLSGRLTVDGNKNSALPLLAACLLTGVAMWVLHPPAVRAPARFDAAFVSVGVYCAMAQAMMSATFLSRIVLRESLWAMR